MSGITGIGSYSYDSNYSSYAKISSGKKRNTAADGAAELKDGVKEYTDATATIDGYLGDLKTGVQPLAESVPTLATGVGELFSGAKSAKSAIDLIDNGAQSLSDATGQLKEGAGSLKSGVSSVNDGAGALLKGSKELKEQSRYALELIYIQNRDLVENEAEKALGMNCPNCGAPLSSLGAKVCEYCGSPVLELNIHAWTFSKIYSI